jgi:hypothetical protein
MRSITRIGSAIVGLLLTTQAHADNGMSRLVSNALTPGQIIEYPIGRCDVRPYGDNRAVMVVFLPQGGDWYIWTTDTPTISILAPECGLNPLNSIGIYTWDRLHWNFVIDPKTMTPPA